MFCNSSSLFFDLLYYFSLSSSSSSSSYDHHHRHRHDDDDDYYYYKKGEPTSRLSLFWGTYFTLGELNLTLRLNVLRLKDIYFNNIFFGYVCRVDINNGATELAKKLSNTLTSQSETSYHNESVKSSTFTATPKN